MPANTARFYALASDANLFGDAALIRDEARLEPLQRKIEFHETDGGAMGVLERWPRREQRRGYVIQPDGRVFTWPASSPLIGFLPRCAVLALVHSLPH
jgi:hypothetical protein